MGDVLRGAGTGETEEREHVWNLGLPQLVSEDWLDMLGKGLAWLGAYDPHLVVVSAGFDGLEGDKGNYGLGHLTPGDYGRAMRMVMDWATQPSKRRESRKLLAVLEGGYKVQGGMMSDLATAVANVLTEMTPAPLPPLPSSPS